MVEPLSRLLSLARSIPSPPAGLVEGLEEVLQQARGADSRSGQQMLDLLFTGFIDMIFEFDAGHRFTNAWARDESFFFFPREQFLGKTCSELFAGFPALVELYEGLFQEARWMGCSEPREYVSPFPQDECWYEARMSRTQPLAGDEPRYSLVIRDITRRKLAERRQRDIEAVLERSERLYRSLVESANDAITLFGLDGRVLFRNPAYCQGLGYGPDESMDVSGFDIVHPDDQPRLRETFRALVDGTDEAPPSSQVYRVKHRSGGWIYRHGKAVLLRNEDGQPESVMIIARDITEDVKHKEELRAARDAAEAASRTKSEFLAHMSHELRTPIHGILGMAELVLGTTLDESQESYLKALRTSARELLNIVNDVLDLSKIEAGKFELKAEIFSPQKLVAKAFSIVSPGCIEKQLELRSAVDGSVPEVCSGDGARVFQVLLNLVGNAVKFTHQGEIEVSVSCSGEEGGRRRLVFVVRDTGIGIAPEQQENIFKHFVQGDSSRTKRYGGTGLGLAIARNLASLMGGELSVTSAVGKGSAFRFEVPVAPASALPDPPSEVLQLAPVVWTGVVLAVEDNPTNLRVVSRLMRNLGLQVLAASDGQQALDVLDREAVDLVLMDVHMPVLDGLEATRRLRLRETGRRVPVVVMTAGAMKGDREQCLAAGADDYLPKPFTRSELEGMLRRFLPKKAGE